MGKQVKQTLYIFITIGLTFMVVSCQTSQNPTIVPISGQEQLHESNEAVNDIHAMATGTVDVVMEDTDSIDPTQELDLKDDVQEPPKTCAEKTGQIDEVFVPDTQTGKLVRVLLYFPPCQSMAANEDYSLLILLHGQSAKADQWIELGLNQTLDELYTNEHGYENLIVVMPQEEDYLAPIVDSNFNEFVGDELLRYLENEYPISPDRERRALGGISRGATWALKIGLNEWENFGVIGLHSYPGGINSSILWLKKIPEVNWPDIWMDSGKQDYYLENAQTLEKEFTQYIIPHEWHLNEGLHNEEYWSDQLSDYLAWYLENISADK